MPQEPRSPGASPDPEDSSAAPASGDLARMGLFTEDQFNRLLSAIERHGGLQVLHRLTPEQHAANAAFVRTSTAMGIAGPGIVPAPVARAGSNAVGVAVPASAVQARVFLESGVLTMGVKGGSTTFWLPESVAVNDRVARIEFFDAKGSLVGVSGGEPPVAPALRVNRLPNRLG